MPGLPSTLAYDPRNVYAIAAYYGNTDPALDPANGVIDGKRWVQTTNDTSPYGAVLSEYYRDDGAWEEVSVGGAAPGGTAGGDLAGTYPNPTIKANVDLAGVPTAPTAAPGTNTTQIATTAFVTAAVAAGGGDFVFGDNTFPDTAGGTSDRTGQFNILKEQTTAVSNVNEVVSPLRVAFIKSANCTGNIFDAVNFDASSGASPGTGNMHTLSLTCNFTQNTADEATPLFILLAGTGTGRLWGTDQGVRGPTAAQANLIMGASIYVANQHSGAVTKGCIGLNITTSRSGEAHASATTYPLDYGILLNGMTGAPAGTTAGMKIGIGIGVANLGGWSVSVARVEKGIYIENFDTRGIEFGGSYTGSPQLLYKSGIFALTYDGRLALNGSHTPPSNVGLFVFAGSTVLQGAALSTSATDGFLYLPSCAGTPSGAPTGQTGTIPIVIDSSNSKLYARLGGSWVDIVAAGGGGGTLDGLSDVVAPSPSDGEVLTWDSGTSKWVNEAVPGGSGWTVIVKPTNETISSSAALQDDDHLTFSVSANTNYQIRGKMFYETTANADFKPQLTFGGTITAVRVFRRMVVPGGTAYVNMAIDTGLNSPYGVTSSSAGAGVFEFDIALEVGASGGTFKIQWAQNTSDPSNTTMRAGSYIEYHT